MAGEELNLNLTLEDYNVSFLSTIIPLKDKLFYGKSEDDIL